MQNEPNPNDIKGISLIPEAPPNALCDAWGNICVEPCGQIEERHGDYFVRIFIHNFNDRYYYGYQLKIGTMIRQRVANAKDQGFSTTEIARSSASVEIERVCNTNKNVKKLFADFLRIRYNQGTLFKGEGDE